jgi:rhodanese-related sulfurtransferase
VDDLRQRWETLPRDRRIWVVCRSGFRGHLAVRILKERGFADVVNVTGGHLSILAADGLALEEA